MLRHPALVPLSHQHHDGLLLCVRMERQGDDPTIAAERIVEAFDHELRNHFDLEEELLFPESRPEAAAEIAAEHRELERLVEHLRTSPSAALVAQFASLLRAHIRREEQEWFEELQQSLPPDRLRELGAQFAARALRARRR